MSYQKRTQPLLDEGYTKDQIDCAIELLSAKTEYQNMILGLKNVHKLEEDRAKKLVWELSKWYPAQTSGWLLALSWVICPAWVLFGSELIYREKTLEGSLMVFSGLVFFILVISGAFRR